MCDFRFWDLAILVIKNDFLSLLMAPQSRPIADFGMCDPITSVSQKSPEMVNLMAQEMRI
jgi:hypothetical protein